MHVIRACLMAVVCSVLAAPVEARADDQWKDDRIDFTRDIQPILVDHCFACHGPDAETREADLRLDVKADLFAPRANGQMLVVPGNREASQLLQRIATDDPTVKMPPPDDSNLLSSRGIELIGRWIDEGAAWGIHWSFESPHRPPTPRSHGSSWRENTIDAFTHERMTQQGLTPQHEAERAMLMRRVTFDLTGLPPTIAEIDAFVSDTAPDAYLRVVDRLLHSPRFGERMATHWLDLARYADTHGYHMDAHRDMWRWRDWVIAAYNDNMPFDQFTIEQLAGDLLPRATTSQRIATGFNRNNMVNFENGAIAEEFLTEYAVDRVTTTSTVWLGQTMVCARCHDHKYDPFTQREFYQMFALFNQVPENGVDGNMGNAAPLIPAPLPNQSEQLDELESRLATLQVTRAKQEEAADAAIIAWETTLEVSDTRMISVDPELAVDFDKASLELEDAIRGTKLFVEGKIGDALLFDGKTHVDLGDRLALDGSDCLTITAWLFPTTRDLMIVTERVAGDDREHSLGVAIKDGKVLFRMASSRVPASAYATSGFEIVRSKWQHVAVRFDAAVADVSVFVNGRRVAVTGTNESFSSAAASKASLFVGSADSSHPFRGMMDELRIYPKALSDEEIGIIAGGDPISDILAVARQHRTEQQAKRLQRYFLEQFDPEYRSTMQEMAATRRSLDQLRAAIPTTMVMQEVAERRPTHILKRGRYDSPGELVRPGVPDILQPPADEVTSRLALARWLVEPDHPLTARVAVNHLWQSFFGAGLVRTPEDFGTRGELPTHPELLDWLATELASDWDIKRLIRLLVTSATYRQSNQSSPERLASDPENRWLARASRRRLTAEMVRDSALCVSGLLVEQTGGPSVFPYQPEGLWEEIAYNANDFTAQAYRQSHGSDLYRRSIYTFVKRSLPSPTLTAFDAPNRETCITRRPRTNTPQQALVLMNDVTFVEAARSLAQQSLAENETKEERIDAMFRGATSRAATIAERDTLLALIRDLEKEYEAQRHLAHELSATGELPVNEQFEATELAVWTAVANVILSLDEAISRP